MTDGVAIFLCGTFFGGVVGATLAWHRFCRTERPTLEIKVTPEVVAQLNEQMVTDWLTRRGLVWMPAGVDFKPKVKR